MVGMQIQWDGIWVSIHVPDRVVEVEVDGKIHFQNQNWDLRLRQRESLCHDLANLRVADTTSVL